MNEPNLKALFATTALTATAFALPTAAFAQDAPAAAEAEYDTTNDIVVTARRSEENLQDVPVSVQVVTGDSLQKLSITKADEISKLAPGLTLSNEGASTQVILRGVAWRPGSGTAATPIFFNEAGFDPGQTVQSLFDIGQIEVLRGPQGTSRGAPSISGAITITTRKPDLSEFGGFVRGQYGEADHFAVQAAINVPIIRDVLAIRLATNIEDSEGTRVYSVNSNVKPRIKDRSYRATVLFQPTDTLSIQAMYQRRRTNTIRYDQVVGPGSPGAPASATAFFGTLGAVRANFNGPALTIGQRASVQDGGYLAFERLDLLTVNANWEVFNHDLSVNYGRQFSRGRPSNLNAQDPLNILPGFEPYSTVANDRLPRYRTMEVRLSSKSDPDRPFDYDIGWYSKHSGGGNRGLSQQFNSFLSGAFGAPNALPGALTTPNLRYSLPITVGIQLGQVFDSFYGNLRFHISDNTELSGGLAIVRDRVPVTLDTIVGAGVSVAGPLELIKLSFPAFLRPLVTSCEGVNAFNPAGLFTSPNYPGVCEVNVRAGTGAPPRQSTNEVYSKALYNFSLSHRFSDAVLAYATTGTSFRTGLPALGNVGLPTNLFIPEPETAVTYEVGIKTNPGRALTINASLFQIDYNNQLTSFQGVRYFNSVTGRPDLGGVAFYRNVDARVRGAELEIAARPLESFSLAANFSYSKIKSQGGNVPCNKNEAVAGNALSAANPINFCPSAKGQVLNQNAPFQATVNGSYDVPLGSFDGYFRFNANYQGKNPNFGNFADPATGRFKSVPSYAIVDLFVGITGGNDAWDLGIFAKNVFDKQVELQRNTPVNNIYAPYAGISAGYDVVRVSLPREIGVQFRYSFGSR